MLKSLITSQTRVRLLVRFFMNSNSRAWLRGLEAEFGESTNGIRMELNRLEEASLLVSERIGNKKIYRANTRHRFYNEIHNLVLKETGIDTVVGEILKLQERLERIYLTGQLAMGIDNNSIELLLVTPGVTKNELLGKKLRQQLKSQERKIKWSITSSDPPGCGEERVLIWKEEKI